MASFSECGCLAGPAGYLACMPLGRTGALADVAGAARVLYS